MQQILCGVDDVVVLNGCRVQVLAVGEELVTFGVSLGGGDQRIVELQLPAARCLTLEESSAVVSSLDSNPAQSLAN